MACIRADGTLTEAARSIVALLEDHRSEEELAEKTGLPLYRIRSAMRELVSAGVAESRDGRFFPGSNR